MTVELREIAAHLKACWGSDYRPTRLVAWDDPGEVTRRAHEPMPEAERKKWETDRLERHIAALRGTRTETPTRTPSPYDASRRPSLVDKVREQERREAEQRIAQRKGKGPYDA